MSEWIEWHGGECPVPDGTLVHVRYRDGEESVILRANIHDDENERDAGYAFWRNDGYSNDIVAYRIIHQKPCKSVSESLSFKPGDKITIAGINGGNTNYRVTHNRYPLDELHMHELLDRVSVLQDQFERHIAEHPAAEQFRRRIKGISKRLGKLYQEIGAVNFKDTENGNG
jgi:hypothetical protein